MPELPEVHTFAEYIKKHCRNLKIKDVSCFAPKLVKPSCAHVQKKITNRVIDNVNQIGKYIIITFKNISDTLIIHFGMSGTVHYAKTGSEKNGDDRFTRVIFMFTNDFELRWIDKRKFGKVLLVQSLDQVKAIKEMGQNPLLITKKQFLMLLEKHESQNIKRFLMDQTNLAGIGNEYSDEILYQAGINPHDSIKELTIERRTILFKEMQGILKQAIELHRPWDKFEPKKWLQAHRRKGDHCPKNKNHILRLSKIGGRTSYWCPIHQKK